MHLSFVLAFALSIFAVMGHQSRYYQVPADSGESYEQEDPSLEYRCGCRYITSCPIGHRDYTIKTSCSGLLNVHCCSLVPVSEKSNKHQTPSPHQLTTQKTPTRPEVQAQIFAQIPTKNLTPEPKPKGPLLTSFPQPSISVTSSEPHSPIPSEVSPSSNVVCVCTPFFRCYDEETSSNLTNVVNDRSTIPLCLNTKAKHTCPGANDICCCNRDKPSQKPQQLPPSQNSASDCEGKCTPIDNCNEENIFNKNSKLICPGPKDVCCLERVQNSTTTFHTSPQTPTLRPALMPQPPSSTASPILSESEDGCICTPFFNCYDQETSSNLTGLVNDRSVNLCPEPNDVCCNNLAAPSDLSETTSSSTITITTTDCSGTCVNINDCPDLSNTWKEAKEKNSDAIKKLRQLVCPVTNGRVNVCCQPE